MDIPELKPCPFCNEAPHVDKTVREYPADDKHPAGEYEAWVNVSCDTCGFQIGEEYRLEAVREWNRRAGRYAPEGTFAERLAQAEAIIEDLLPMESELWAAGADQDTAEFVARMLSQNGFSLVKDEEKP